MTTRPASDPEAPAGIAGGGADRKPGERALWLGALSAAVAGAATLRALQAGLVDGARLGLLLLAVGTVVLAAAHRFGLRDSDPGRPTRRLSVGIGVTLGLAIAGTGAVSGLTFMPGQPALVLALVLVFFGLLVVASGRVLAAPLLRDLDDVRTSIDATGSGVPAGPGFRRTSYAELDDVAGAGRAMLERLAGQEADRQATEVSRREGLVAYSHDLRTPLTSLRLLTEAIEHERDAAVRLRYLRRLGTHVDALSALVTDVFELARLEACDVRWSKLQVAMDDIVEETVEGFIPAAQAKRIRLDMELPTALPPVEAAPEKLQRVLFNLLHNALRHTAPDGRVTVRVRGVEDALEVEVADTGDGIAPEERQRVFDPFYRRPNAPAGAGAGLGLTISRGIVQAHGGRIWIDEASRGTSVRFSLPLVAGPAAATAATRPAS